MKYKIVIKPLKGNYDSNYDAEDFVSNSVEIPDRAGNIQVHVKGKPFFITYIMTDHE